MMNNVLLYALTVLIWGSTWFAILFQLGDVAEEVSVAYRFALAAALLFIFCWYKKLPLKFSIREHFQAFILGTALFSLNYYFFYVAENYINSALTAIGFSTMIVFNTINARIFYRSAITNQVVLGSVVGIAGIFTLFWPELTQTEYGNQTLTGLGFCLLGTVIASFGNMTSIKNQKMAMPMIQTNAWGMAYGALVMAIFALISGKQFSFSLTWSYVGSLIYLSVFGSIIAFGCYLTLLTRIGAHKASYATILFPAVAVLISSVFEDFQWHVYTVVGLLLIISGNLILIIKPKWRFYKRGIKPMAS